MATEVRYKLGTTLIGTGTVAPDYAFNWTTAPAGSHAITAELYVDGVLHSSDVVNVTVEYVPSGSITGDANTVLSLRAHDGYTGNLITVNNLDGTNPVAIGVVDGELDTQAIINNFPTGSVRVTEWYNQKNPSIKYVPDAITNAPEICFNGVIKTVGGKPALYFDGNDILRGPSLMNSLNASVFTVFQQAIGGYFGIVSDEDSTTSGNRFAITASTLTTGSTAKVILVNISEGVDQRMPSINVGLLNTPYSRTVTINAGVTKARINGVEQGSFTRAALIPNAEAVIGAQTVSNTLFLKGYISEIIAFPTAKESAAPSIETNQMAFYSI